jgi:predicted PurR-regulated permease PerM
MLSLVAILAFALVKFQYLLGPLVLAFVFSYLIHPLASMITNKLKIPWQGTVTLIYLILLLSFIGLLAWGGISLLDQVQSLISFLERTVANIPTFFNNLAVTPLVLGPFQIDLTHLNMSTVGEQLLGIVQPLLTQVGSLVGSVASSTASVIGWIFFCMIVSYFVLVETGGARERILNFQLPGYQADFARIGSELSRIWNAYLRGQTLIIVITMLVYTALLGGMGVRFFIGLALLACAARFVPYVGPFVAWTTYGLVAFFQGTTLFGMQPLTYALVVIAFALVIDNVIDQFVSPRIMADALKVHPAALLVAVLIGASLFGVIGVLFAGPVLASLQLIFRYVMRKLLDQDPWEGHVGSPAPISLRAQVREVWQKVIAFFKRSKPVKK